MGKKPDAYNIIEEENEIDDHLLDIIGNEFKFDHQKGLSEWIKNSADAYIRSNTSKQNQFLILNFNDRGESGSIIECIDFVGMTVNDINKAFKRWGDPEAARRGLKKKTYGGHGNGGKFYMRQMFEQSHFITYSSGKLNIFGFNKNKKYGFADDFKNISISPSKAVKISGFSDLPISNSLFSRVYEKKTGFTIVRGVRAQGMPNKLKPSKICEKLRNHPQARRLLERMNVMVIYNGELIFERLYPEKLKPKVGFEEPLIFSIPQKLSYKDGGETHFAELHNKKFPQGRLILKTSEEAMETNGRLGDLNRIDVLGELGSIASYKLHELGLGIYPQSVFIYGEVDCPILEDPDDDCVKNDRSKLISENPKTKALLAWVAERVNELAEKIADDEKKEREKLIKKQSKDYNEFLNKWSSKFLNKIRSEILVGSGFGPGFGEGSGGSSGGYGKGKNNGDGRGGFRKGEEDGGGSNPKKKSRNPMVLLSSYDEDPLNPGSVVNLDLRQGVIYQRVPDVEEGIYWINTSSPLAKSIIERFGEKSQQWRSYLFQRYIDIFVKEEIRNLFKKDSEMFNPDYIDSAVFGEFMTKIYTVASQDLKEFLLNDSYYIEELN